MREGKKKKRVEASFWGFVKGLCKSRSFLFVVSLGLLSPLWLSANNSTVSNLGGQVRSYEFFVHRQEAELRACRSTCVNSCRMRCASPEDCNCSISFCDSGDCSQARANYDESRSTLESLKNQLVGIESQQVPNHPSFHGSSGSSGPNQQVTNSGYNSGMGTMPSYQEGGSVIDKVREKKQKMKKKTLLGAAASAALWVKAYSCCSKVGLGENTIDEPDAFGRQLFAGLSGLPIIPSGYIAKALFILPNICIPSASAGLPLATPGAAGTATGGASGIAGAGTATGGFLCGGPTACKLWLGAAAASTLATAHMAGQSKALNKTEQMMCENPTAGGCPGASIGSFAGSHPGNFNNSNGFNNPGGFNNQASHFNNPGGSNNQASHFNNPGGSSNPDSSGSFAGHFNNPNFSEYKLPPSCANTPNLCRKILDVVQSVNNSSSQCSPGDTACLQTETSEEKAFSSLEEEMKKQLLTPETAPQGGWPEGALAGGEDFSLEKLTPEQQMEVKRLLGQVDKANKGFLTELGGGPGDKLGLDSESLFGLSDSKSGSSGSDSGSAGDLASVTDPSSASFAGGSSSFASLDSDLAETDSAEMDSAEMDSEETDSTGFFAGSGGSRHPSSSAYGFDFDSSDPDLDSKGKSSGLARQMNQMLREFDTSRNGGGSGKDPFAGKSVDFGSDIVGPVEDNIFMMVHRSHRFLKDRAILP